MNKEGVTVLRVIPSERVDTISYIDYYSGIVVKKINMQEYVNQLSTQLMTGEEEVEELKEPDFDERI